MAKTNVLEDAIMMMRLPEFESKWMLFSSESMKNLCDEANYPYRIFNDSGVGDICLRAKMKSMVVEYIVVKNPKELHRKAIHANKRTLRHCDAYINQILNENEEIVLYRKPQKPDGDIVIS